MRSALNQADIHQLRMRVQRIEDQFKALIDNEWVVVNYPEEHQHRVLDRQGISVGSGPNPVEAIDSAIAAKRLNAKCQFCGHAKHMPRDCAENCPECPCTYAKMAIEHGWVDG